MIFEVTVLGSNSSIPTLYRNPSAQVLNVNDYLFLIDCGEGTQMQFNRYGIRKNRINEIFISHAHGDHYLGLIGFIQSMHLTGRSKVLTIFGPIALKSIIDQHLEVSGTQLSYQMDFVPTNPDTSEIIFENKNITVETIILDHRIPCTGFLFKEKPKRRRVIKHLMEEHKIPIDYLRLLKDGNDYTDKNGNRIPNKELTKDPRPSYSYAYCSDTAYKEDIIPQISSVDLLYHEATFMHDMQERASYTRHSTTIEAATIAAKAKVGKLMIGHYSARYNDLQPLLMEARTVFENTELAIEGKIYSAVSKEST